VARLTADIELTLPENFVIDEFTQSGELAMKLSARNQISGTIVKITPGTVNGTIKVDIGGGNIVTSSLTEEAIADLALAVGDAVTVIVKASDVLIGK
jgi:molybdopterin-binding protein